MKNLWLSLVGIALSFSVLAKEYDEVFPEYFEYCTATQVKYTKDYFNGAEGGVGGHGFLYVHGLCKDYDADYPQVKPCDKEGEGVGISLDSDYKNVMWVAVPGRELMINGVHSTDDSNLVDLAEIEAVKREALKLEIFKGVKLKSNAVNNHEFGSDEYQLLAAEWSIGTDLAIRYGRGLRCVRTPVKKKQIKELATYLNAQNDLYYKTGKKYEWSFLYNNCTHLTMNAGNSMGLNRSIKTDQKFLGQLMNIANPANAYMLLSDEWTLKKPTYSSLKHSKTIKKYGMHPNQVGALNSILPAFRTNVMFKTDDIKGLNLPRKKVKKMFSTAPGYDKFMSIENTDLEENMVKWKKIYRKMQVSLIKKGKSETPEYQYILEQLELIKKNR